MAQKKPVQGGSREPYRGSDFRDSHAQKQYREQSQSKNKDKQDVAHKLSLDVMATVLNDHRSPGRIPKSETSDVKELVNAFDNMRMVDQSTNRSDHVKLDSAIKEKAKTHKPLTAREEHRAVQSAEVVLEHKGKLKSGTAQCFKNFYGNLQTKSGETVWKKAKNEQAKK